MHESKQRALEELREGPVSKEELADELDVTPEHARDGLIGGLRSLGFEIEYDRSTCRYELLSDCIDDDGLVTALEDGLTELEAQVLGIDDFDARLESLREQGYEVRQRDTGEYFIPETLDDQQYVVGDGDGTYRFALIGDTHLGSQAEHLDELHDFYDLLQDRGISTVFHAGDITDGWQVYQGHINEVKGEAAGWGRLIDYTVRNYPERDGIQTYFIDGNHDHKYFKQNGVHLGKIIADRRPDLHFLGDSMARIVFDAANDVDLELVHPAGGKPYTEGYRAQTLYRERPTEHRPTLAGIGHLHGSMYVHTEGVRCWYVGAWKGLTNYGKRRGHDACTGGWVIEMTIKHGEVRSLSQEWIEYPTADSTQSWDMEELDSPL